MSLSRFKYLTKNRLSALILILTASSILFSITALSLLGFYRSFTAYLGEENNVIVIHDKASSTPFTGLVPTYLAEEIAKMKGISACSPEALAPCIINGKALFIRGILPEEFKKITKLKMIAGENLDSEDLNTIILGSKAAEKLGVKVNSKVMVLGVLADRYFELTVKGIYSSASAMDDEALAPLHVGQWLRGAGYNYVTLIRIKINQNQITPSAIYEKIEKIASESSAQPLPQTQTPSTLQGITTSTFITRVNLEKIGIKEAQEFMTTYINKYGLTREIMLTFSAVIFLFSSASVINAVKVIIAHHKGELSILRAIGASKKLLKQDLSIKLLPWALMASMAGFIISAAAITAIQTQLNVEILSHTLMPVLDPIVPALTLILTAALIIISILKTEVEA